MAIGEINNYAASSSYRTSSSDSSKNGVMSNQSMTMEDFMKLLAAQMSNQDAMNPTDNTEFVSQMAQFTSLQAMQTLTELTYAQYGASMVGKTVYVASYNAAGEYTQDEGVVESVRFADGHCYPTVNGKEYNISSIMAVKDPKSVENTENVENTETEQSTNADTK